ncbi:YktB family protein [Paenibacillus chungangensis]|uniref:UPF0637 protein ACFQ2I_07990 n=1 Tax=Paenibacillus chungangensis TaxID=696535 RepID=A0ABW3HP50_9BACL
MSTSTITSYTGFTSDDFAVFQLPGLEERMAAIQNQIQPKFRSIGKRLTEELFILSGREMHLHIARHARRKVNPPKDTWLSICSNKRGYKAHPHFQLGLFDDHLFLWLALIYEVPNKQNIASAYLNRLEDVIEAVPDSFVVSQDHMKKEAVAAAVMSEADWRTALIRFRDVGKAELLIGRHLAADDELLRDEDELAAFALSTYETLLPLYHIATDAQ